MRLCVSVCVCEFTSLESRDIASAAFKAHAKREITIRTAQHINSLDKQIDEIGQTDQTDQIRQQTNYLRAPDQTQ